jgi:hypothetical protein
VNIGGCNNNLLNRKTTYMKKVILINGIIGGFIVSALMVIATLYFKSTGDFENGMIYGYASMILAFIFIFVGIKSYRDKYNSGLISFGKAFKIGLLIALITSTFYVVTWLFEYFYVFTDFAEIYAKETLAKARESGATAAELAKKTAEIAKFNEMYKNPFFNALITYTEILPVGLVVSLISAFFLKKK